jgi:ABC-type glycerol-3-phosphate transport system substrate-binding protein
MSQFNLIVIGILMALALVAVLLISGVIPGFSLGSVGRETVPIEMWGTIPANYLGSVISGLNEKNSVFNLAYVQKDAATYETELVNALASGKGPDIWFISQDLILKHRDKIFSIPFASFDERSFKNTFIEEGELFLSADLPAQAGGIIALPFSVDPIVLYWNRDLFTNAAIAQPPKNWDEFVSFAQKLTIRDASANIFQAGAALGEFQNVEHAKDIISLLILQTGNPIIDPQTLKSTLTENNDSALNPAESALRFFTEFSDPTKVTYSWNRSLANSRNAFIAGTLAMYFGYASEYKDIASKNPHLNFDVSEVPQIKDGPIQATFSRMYGLAISKTSSNVATALTAISDLIVQDAISEISQAAYSPPVRRDLLSEAVKDSVLSVFYKSAIKSRAWLEPDPSAVSDLFGSMVENVLTGKRKISEAVSDASKKLDVLLKGISKQ